MTSRRRWEKVAMATAGLLAIGAAEVGLPGTGTAAVPDPAPVTSTSLTAPGDVQHVVDEVGRSLPGGDSPTSTSSTTTSSTSSTTTSSTSSTTTTTSIPTTPDEIAKTPEKAVGAAHAIVDGVTAPGETNPAEVPIEQLVRDYRRTDFPAYTPVFGKRSTADVIALLDRARAGFDQVARVLAPFPVAGAANYSDDWGAPRTFPTFHLHEGCDIFAARGTPVIATSEGTVSRIDHTPIGGNVVYLTTADGTYYYYAHLDEISPLLSVGMRVEPGHVLGTVGNTGDADGGPTHLHFEIHPAGGSAVPPAPYLDSWLALALQKAQALSAGERLPAPTLPRFPTPAQQAGLATLRAQPASFGDDGQPAAGLLVLFSPGLFFVWRRRRKAIAFLDALRDRV